VRHDGIITLLRQQAAIANEILSKKKKTRQGDDQPVVTSHAVEYVFLSPVVINFYCDFFLLVRKVIGFEFH